MGSPEDLNNHQNIFDQALKEGLRRNEEQFKVWTSYKARHKKVIEGLEKISLEIGINCMVPIGKKALMKGRLVHTNEVLVSLGEEYFAKYSAAKAIALCNRRIQQADEMLKCLEVERDLYEMRQIIPLQYNAFGDVDRSDLIEHWTEQDLDNWRITHKEKEREYKQKLSKLKNQEKSQIESEDDLFRRLDELELEEELGDELDRLDNDYYEEDNEDYSEEDSSSEEVTTEMIEKELLRLREIWAAKDPTYATSSSNENELAEKEAKEIEETKDKLVNQQKPGRRVSFVEPLLTKEALTKQGEETENIKVDNIESKDCVQDSNDEYEPLTVNITHSNVNPEIQMSVDGQIETPWDIYKLHSAPKPILKKFTNESLYVRDIGPSNESSAEEEDETEEIKASAYQTVVKDIQEKKVVVSKTDTLDVQSTKRPISKFKMERRNMRK